MRIEKYYSYLRRTVTRLLNIKFADLGFSEKMVLFAVNIPWNHLSSNIMFVNE